MKNTTSDAVKIAIIWKTCKVAGQLDVCNGNIKSLSTANYGGSINGSEFDINSEIPARLTVELDDIHVQTGAYATRITGHANEGSFTFFLRDALFNGPLLIPMYSIAVTSANDNRAYEEIESDIQSRHHISDWQRIEQSPEETYEDACHRNRDMKCPTWLGLSRDVRIFQFDYDEAFGYWGWVKPMYHSKQLMIPKINHQMLVYFEIGRGSACRVNIERWLDNGILPIVHSTQKEEDIIYNVTAFASLETQPPTVENLRGTDWLAAYSKVNGSKLDEATLCGMAELIQKETTGREEELICCVRVEAVNKGSEPQYAWFSGAKARVNSAHPALPDGEIFNLGKSVFKDLSIYAVSRINGQPMPQREMAVLIAPGETAVFEIIIPHSPINDKRADRLMAIDFNEHLEGVRKFWTDKLQSGAKINIPEKAIDERIQACLLNCDINTLGLASEGPLLATVGNYGPIGSESAPMIQFFDSMGWHDVAQRSLDFFLELQREDGFIQTYDEYQLETGPVLWSMGEHYRYTHDKKWLERVTPNIIKACDYIVNSCKKNMQEELRGKGYGMMSGRVADPEDYFHAFMLNGLAYLGMARSVEMLAETNPEENERFANELKEFKKNIRESLIEAIACSPVIPLGDGKWIPTVPSWPGYPGAMALYAEGGNWWTHGMFGGRDSLCGALYLLLGEVVDPNESAGEIILKFHQKLFTVENAGLSQPYYCRHDYGHLKRDEVKLFLKTYYNQLTSLQDRQTYTFWEHYFHASPNKTHETGWFLMQTRWMLYMEEGNSLCLLRAIPRKWMENGKSISIENAATYFGKLSIKVESQIDQGFIKAEISCNNTSGLNEIKIRLPHPQGLHAKSCIGGKYDSCKETVTISPFTGNADVILEF